MLKCRVLNGLTQGEVARSFGVNENSYNLWEQDKAVPLVGYYPGIFAFLGYDPFPLPATLAEQIGSKRRSLGLTQEEAAGLLGVDEGTFARWENGTFRPLLSGERITRFLDARTRDDLLRDRLSKRGRPSSSSPDTKGPSDRSRLNPRR